MRSFNDVPAELINDYIHVCTMMEQTRSDYPEAYKDLNIRRAQIHDAILDFLETDRENETISMELSNILEQIMGVF